MATKLSLCLLQQKWCLAAVLFYSSSALMEHNFLVTSVHPTDLFSGYPENHDTCKPANFSISLKHDMRPSPYVRHQPQRFLPAQPSCTACFLSVLLLGCCTVTVRLVRWCQEELKEKKKSEFPTHGKFQCVDEYFLSWAGTKSQSPNLVLYNKMVKKKKKVQRYWCILHQILSLLGGTSWQVFSHPPTTDLSRVWTTQMLAPVRRGWTGCDDCLNGTSRKWKSFSSPDTSGTHNASQQLQETRVSFPSGK